MYIHGTQYWEATSVTLLTWMDGSWETENGNFIILFIFGTLCFILSSKNFPDKDIELLQWKKFLSIYWFVISSPVLLLIYKLSIWSDKCILGTNFHNFTKISITLHNYPFFVVLIITVPNMLSIRFQKLLISWLKLFLFEYRCPSQAHVLKRLGPQLVVLFKKLKTLGHGT